MCLAVPAEVIDTFDNDIALVDVGGNTMRISTMLVEGVEQGAYVLVHAGFAIETIDEAEARRTRELLEELSELE